MPPMALTELIQCDRVHAAGMTQLNLVLLILALVCFIIAAAGVTVRRVNFIGAGLALWVLTLILPALR